MALPLQALSLLRLFIGTSSFLLPSLTTTTLLYPVTNTSLLAVRLFGCRDALLGTLLWTANTPEAKRRAVLAGAAVDALDIVAVAWGRLGGDVEKGTVVTLYVFFFLLFLGVGSVWFPAWA